MDLIEKIIINIDEAWNAINEAFDKLFGWIFR
jgi:hypothetical protein